MKNTIVILAVIGLPAMISYTMAAPENPNVGSPFSNRNTVPSANQPRRMITQPNASSGNLIVTGNVGGLNYFRGMVPYSSGYSSGAYANDSGSSSVASFLRRSADPIVSDRNPGTYRSYFQPGRTVSSYGSRPDGSSGLSESMIPNQGSTSYVIPGLPQLRSTQFNPRPLISNPQELDVLLSRQIEQKEQAKLVSNEPQKESADTLNPYNSLTPDQIRDLIEKQNPPSEDPGKPQLNPDDIFAEFTKESSEALNNRQTDPFAGAGSQGEEQTDTTNEDPSPVLRDSSHVAEGRAILGEHKTFDSLAEAKTSMYLDAAQKFLKEGQFYKAADTYTLAEVWKPKDARVHFGQSIALFAAGEYMSSAYYLSRAFQLDSKIASIRYDVPGIIGSRDTYEDRILEIVQWQQQTRSPELGFLLAYLYYQDGKTESARISVNAAFDAMPDSPAVQTLKNMIIPESANQ